MKRVVLEEREEERGSKQRPSARYFRFSQQQRRKAPVVPEIHPQPPHSGGSSSGSNHQPESPISRQNRHSGISNCAAPALRQPKIISRRPALAFATTLLHPISYSRVCGPNSSQDEGHEEHEHEPHARFAEAQTYVFPPARSGVRGRDAD